MSSTSNTESVLNLIREKEHIGFTEIENLLGISKEDIIQALIELKTWGYSFHLNDISIGLAATPDSLIDTEIMYQLNTKYIGNKIISYQSVKSTNETAHRFAESGEPEGTIITSEEQTKGKGRFGRIWFSKQKAGIYLSIILKPGFTPENAPGLSVMTAVALADTLSEMSNAGVQIKWPNDVLLNGKKTAGILTELSAEKEKINHIVVGVGINVNHSEDDFPDELKKTATSVNRESEKKINRIELVKKFLEQFEKLYDDYKTDQLEKVAPKIIAYSSLIGQHIKLSFGNSIIEGDVIDINKKGSLLLNSEGKIKTVNSGEVTIVKE